MSKVSEKIELLESETDRVYRWRYESLLRAGLTDEVANSIASGEFDLHRAEDMLRRGCSPEHLAAIAS